MVMLVEADALLNSISIIITFFIIINLLNNFQLSFFQYKFINAMFVVPYVSTAITNTRFSFFPMK